MSEQRVDTAQLGELASSLQELISYSAALRDTSAAFAYMLPADWVGPASAQFLGAFETWAVSAEGLRAQTEQLQLLVAAVRTAYDTTSTELDSSWSSALSQLG